jgi:signal transduction histidine kinase
VVKTPIRDARGAILGTQCIFWDVTERHRFIEELRQKNEALAASAEALRRSHEELKSAQLQLIQAGKMESIATLAAGVAHEVKNPLAILQMGLNYLAGKVPAEAKVTLVLDEMREAIQRADNITRGLLNFAADQAPVVQPVDLNLLLQDSLRLLRHELASARIGLEMDLAPDLPEVAVDRTQIQQVFLNVFLNAIQAMPQGGRLRVRTFTRTATASTHSEGNRSGAGLWPGDLAVITEIEDSGPGIPEANLPRVFDPFFTTKPAGVGTGLGLPVSRKIIELHGGRIDLGNRPEGGARVSVALQARKPSP